MVRVSFAVKWKCMICSKQFTSEAKEYDPFYFKIMKVTVKKTLFRGVEAKPTFLPCCNIPVEQLNSYKFHKIFTECSRCPVPIGARPQFM